jgi:hypothetical protein
MIGDRVEGGRLQPRAETRRGKSCGPGRHGTILAASPTLGDLQRDQADAHQQEAERCPRNRGA